VNVPEFKREVEETISPEEVVEKKVRELIGD
jgi:hypothetical protein